MARDTKAAKKHLTTAGRSVQLLNPPARTGGELSRNVRDPPPVPPGARRASPVRAPPTPATTRRAPPAAAPPAAAPPARQRARPSSAAAPKPIDVTDLSHIVKEREVKESDRKSSVYLNNLIESRMAPVNDKLDKLTESLNAMFAKDVKEKKKESRKSETAKRIGRVSSFAGMDSSVNERRCSTCSGGGSPMSSIPSSTPAPRLVPSLATGGCSP